jgi:hypothetical protein
MMILAIVMLADAPLSASYPPLEIASSCAIFLSDGTSEALSVNFERKKEQEYSFIGNYSVALRSTGKAAELKKFSGSDEAHIFFKDVRHNIYDINYTYDLENGDQIQIKIILDSSPRLKLYSNKSNSHLVVSRYFKKIDSDPVVYDRFENLYSGICDSDVTFDPRTKVWKP